MRNNTLTIKRQKYIMERVTAMRELYHSTLESTGKITCIETFLDSFSPPLSTPAEFAYFKFSLSCIGIDYDRLMMTNQYLSERILEKSCTHKLKLSCIEERDAVTKIVLGDGRIVEVTHWKDNSDYNLRVIHRAIYLAYRARIMVGLNCLKLDLVIFGTTVFRNKELKSDIMKTAFGYAIDLTLLSGTFHCTKHYGEQDCSLSCRYDYIIDGLETMKKREDISNIPFGPLSPNLNLIE